MERLTSDAGDLDFGERAAEPLGFVVSFATLELEGDSLGAPKLIEHLGGDGCALDERSAYRCAGTVVHEENLNKANLVIDLNIELFDIEFVAFLDAVLFAAGLDYCVGHWIGNSDE